MRVAIIHYRDGTYGMYEPSNYSFADGVDPKEWMLKNTIEILDETWNEYLRFEQLSATWQARIQKYDEALMEQKHR